MLKDHIRDELGDIKIDKVTFRDKGAYYLSAFCDGECVYKKRNDFDIFYIGFLKGLFFRDACYSCRFATPHRIGDLTLGDFWGFKSQNGVFPVKHNNGLSVVLVNTKKGDRLFSSCNEFLFTMERELAEAVAGNRQLRFPSRKHGSWDAFRKQYIKKGFGKAANRALWIEKIKYWILTKIGQ